MALPRLPVGETWSDTGVAVKAENRYRETWSDTGVAVKAENGVGMQLNKTGVWYFTEAMTADGAADFARRVESLGYSTLWIPETLGRDAIVHAGHLLDATTTLNLATGIANIHHRHPGLAAQAAATLAEQSGGRFVLGLGVSHQPIVEGLRGIPYEKPLSGMRKYLEAMAASPYSAVKPDEPAPVVLAALGPKMLELSGELADGAHPYWTTPEHTARAREILGPDKLLCVEQKIVWSTEPTVARTAAIGALGMYADLPNYRNNWKRLGFSEDEIENRDDRFVDAVVAWGDEPSIRARIDEHYSAGATQVCVQPVNPQEGSVDPDWNALEALAPD